MGSKNLKIMIFTEGTILMHESDVGLPQEAIVQKVKNKEKTIRDFANYIPISNTVAKIKNWSNQGAQIIYLTSRRSSEEVGYIQDVLNRHNFPKGKLQHRTGNEGYKDVAERIMPDILIEDDCESIGGEKEMTYPHISLEAKAKIKSIVVKEFGGIDYLPDNLDELKCLS